jgi:hypothetical protein
MCEEHEYNGAYVHLPGGVEQMDEDGVADYWEKKELKTDLPSLKGYETQQLPIGPEGFSHEKFANALAHINPAYSILGDGKELVNDTATHGLQLDKYDPRKATELKNVSSGGFDLVGKWGEVRDEIGRVTLNFNDALDRLLSDTQHWDGRTKLSAFENVKKSFKAPSLIGQSAGTMQTLVDGFTRAVEYVYQNVEGNRPSYLMTIKAWNSENEHDKPLSDYERAFDNLAQRVLGGHYSETISTISSLNPKFTTGDLPDLGGEEPPPPGPGPGPGPGAGGVPPFSGGAPPFSGPGPVGTPDFKTPKLPTGPDGLPTGPDGLPTGPDGLPTGPGLGDPTQAASAAPTGLGGPSPAGGPAPAGLGKDPREGALGLGPQGLGGPLKKGGGAGGGGGGAGRGPLGANPATGRPAATGVPVTPARAGLAGGALGAGPGSGAGVPPMVPPMAGQRGGDANGKGHQTMKALRRKKTGEEVMGSADAVVPVVGETERPEPAQPEPDDEVQSERRRAVDRPVPRIATGDLRQVP